MSELKREDIISSDALQAPLIMVENLEKMLATLDKVIQKGKEHSVSVGGAETTSKVKKETTELTVEQKELNKVQNQIATAQARNTDEYRKAEEQLKKLRTQLKEKNTLGERDSLTINKQNASINELSAALTKNRKAYADLRTEEQRNSKEGKALLKVIQDQDKEFKELSATIGQHNAHVGNYKEAILEALGPLNMLPGSMGAAGMALTTFRGHISGVTKASQLLRAAMLAIPIFLLITAIVSLIAYFKGTEDGAQKLRIIMAAVGEAISGVVDLVIALGRALSELTLDKVKQGFKDMGDAIKEFVLTRIQLLISGLKGIGESFRLLFAGRFKDAAKTAGKSFLDLNRALNPTVIAVELLAKGINKAKEAAKAFYADLKADVLAAIELQKRENILIVQKRKFLAEEGRMIQRILEARGDAANMDQAATDRYLALQRALVAINDLEGRRIYLKAEELAIAKERAALGESDEATLDHIAQLERELIDITNAKLNAEREITTQISNLRKQILEAEKKAQLKAYADQFQQAKMHAETMLLIKQNEVAAEIAETQKAGIVFADNERNKIKVKQDTDRVILEIQRATGAKLIEENIEQLEEILAAHVEHAKKQQEVFNLTEEEKKELAKQSAIEQAAIEQQLFELKNRLTEEYYKQIAIRQEEQLEALREDMAVTLEIYTMFAESIGNVLATVTERRIAEIEKQQEKLEEQMEYELEIAGDNEEAKAEIEAEFARRQAILERQKIMEQRKQAQYDKATSAIQAAIATALAVTKALPNIPLSIAVGLAGAVQVAAILNKQIPQYAEGTGPTGHPGGLAIVGEQGFELLQQGNRLSLTPGTPTLMDLPAGTKVIPHEETLQALALSGFNYADSTQGNHSDIAELSAIFNKKFDMLNETIKNKREVHINYSKKGVEALIKNAENRIKYLQDFYD